MLHSIEPLIAFNDPLEIWERLPSFLIAEILFIILFFLGFAHAVSSDNSSRNLLIWIACLVGGGSIELLTILEGDEIGNFYHSQATIMLFGRREPFYMIAGCYSWFQYVSVVIANKGVPHNRWRRAALAGLLCSVTWGLLDAVGMKHLWWTWHSSEPLYNNRIWGVPAASSFWILSSGWALSLCVDLVTPFLHRAPYRLVALVLGAIAGPLASVGLMNVPFLLLYHPMVTFGGLHAQWAFWMLQGLCVIVSVPMLWRWIAHPKFTLSAMLLQVVGMFLPALVGIVLAFNPVTFTRTSYSQPFGPCGISQLSFWGAFERMKYVCLESNNPEVDLYDFHGSTELPKDGADWYTVYGTEVKQEWVTYILGQALFLAMVVIAAECAASPVKTKKTKRN